MGFCFLVETHSDADLSQTSCSESNNHSTTVNSLPSNSHSQAVVNLMDIDDNPSNHNTANGFTNHGTVNSTNNSVSNGHSQSNEVNHHLTTDHSSASNGCKKKSSETLDGMEDEGYSDANHTTDMETTQSTDVQKKSPTKEEDQLLIRILQFGRELHALKQQLTIEHGDNQQHDKILQVRILLSNDHHKHFIACRMPSVY